MAFINDNPELYARYQRIMKKNGASQRQVQAFWGRLNNLDPEYVLCAYMRTKYSNPTYNTTVKPTKDFSSGSLHLYRRFKAIAIQNGHVKKDNRQRPFAASTTFNEFANTVLASDMSCSEKIEAFKRSPLSRNPGSQYYQMSKELKELKTHIRDVCKENGHSNKQFSSWWQRHQKLEVKEIQERFESSFLSKKGAKSPSNTMSTNQKKQRKHYAAIAIKKGWNHPGTNRTCYSFNARYGDALKQLGEDGIAEWFANSKFSKTNPDLYKDANKLYKAIESVYDRVKQVVAEFAYTEISLSDEASLLEELRRRLNEFVEDEVAVDALVQAFLMRSRNNAAVS